MAQEQYDAIVVGARCAGSPTAMLLARKGYKVLVVDRATFPSDTLSTHILHPPAVAATAKVVGRSPSTRRWSSERTVGSHAWPRPSVPSSTTRRRSCSAATTRTGATCRSTAGSRSTYDRDVDGGWHPRTTA